MRGPFREEIGVEAIQTDERMQNRAEAELDSWHVDGMPADVDEDAPIHVFRIPAPKPQCERIVLTGGHHRLERVKRAGRDTVWADVWEGTEREAVESACGENKDNPKQLTEQDVQQTAFRLFGYRKNDAEWYSLTDMRIGQILGRDGSYISRLRRKWEDNWRAPDDGQAKSPKGGGRSGGSSGPSAVGKPAPPSGVPLPDVDAACEEGRQAAAEQERNSAQKPQADLSVGVRKVLAKRVEDVVRLTTQLGWWEEAEPLLQPFLTWLQQKIQGA